MILRISLEDVSDPKSPKVFASFLEENCSVIAEELTNLRNEWTTFAIDNIQ
jgi:hypothetical protein